ncbi:MAG: nucleoside hydrolase [Pseudomonadota bacterium]
MSAVRRRSVVIDTDPGIDDAIALLWACGSDALDIRAVTTVAGNVKLGTVTQNALDLLDFAGHRPCVYAGAGRPLVRAPRAETRVHGKGGLGGVKLPPARASVWSMPAVKALTKMLERSDPQTLDLLMLGPMTNLALLLREAPQAAARLGRVIAMGGAIDAPGNVPVGTEGAQAEFNFSHDPEAAAAVFRAVSRTELDLTIIPLDCTRQLRATADWARGLTGKRGKMAGLLIGAYFDATSGAETRPLHDPCVPLFAVMPELFEIETRHLTIDTGERPGMVIDGSHAVKVAMAVDAEAARLFLAQGLA